MENKGSGRFPFSDEVSAMLTESLKTFSNIKLMQQKKKEADKAKKILFGRTDIGDAIMKEYIFHRGDRFYIIEMRDDKDAIANAKHNPGTTKVEDMKGNIIWRLTEEK